jgi:hypothetical protein
VDKETVAAEKMPETAEFPEIPFES